MQGAGCARTDTPKMMVRDHALWLGIAIACVLLLATVTGAILKLRTARGQQHATIDNLNTRIRSWWVMAAVLGGALWAGTLATFALFAIVSLMALREYLGAPSASRTSCVRSWIAGLGICVVCVSYLPALLTLEIPGYSGRNVFLLVNAFFDLGKNLQKLLAVFRVRIGRLC